MMNFCLTLLSHDLALSQCVILVLMIAAAEIVKEMLKADSAKTKVGLSSQKSAPAVSVVVTR